MLKPNVQLMKHQKEGVEFIKKNNGIGAFYYDVGTGKTITALATFSEFRKTQPDLRLLVICPISLIHGAWVKEIEKYTDYGWYDLHGKKFDSRDGKYGFAGPLFPSYFDVFLINFESLIVKKRFEDLMALLQQGNFMVVIDESSKMKNHQAATTEKLIGHFEKGKFYAGIKQMCKHRIIMSGTPAPNVEWEYWAQMNFLDPQILGPNFYAFRNTYFAMQRGREIIRGAVMNKAMLKKMFENGYKYEFDEKKRDQFYGRMTGHVHMVKAKDCLDLPEFVDEYRTVDMTDDQMRVYRQMKNDYIAEIKHAIDSKEVVDAPGSFVVANLILTKMMKLRQITSGFAIDELGFAHDLVEKKNPKIQALLDIVEECGNAQMIVWGQFRWEMQKLVEALSPIAGVSQLHGGIKQEDRIDHVNKFLYGENRFLVAHPDSAAHGLTFINSHIEIFFSYSYSYEEYAQARGRIMRHGQRNNCIYFHILANESVDSDILDVCQKKKNKQEVAERFLKDVKR